MQNDVKFKIDAELANQQKRAMDNERNPDRRDRFLRRLAETKKESEFKELLMKMGAETNNRSLMEAAQSPKTRVITKGSELDREANRR